MSKLFKKGAYKSIFKKILIFSYFSLFLSIKNKLNYCKNEAAIKIDKIGRVKKLFYIIIIILIFQIGVLYLKNNYRNNAFHFNSEMWISLKYKFDPIATAYAKDEFNNKNKEIINVPVDVENFYININNVIRKSISGLSGILSGWFEQFSMLGPQYAKSNFTTSVPIDTNNNFSENPNEAMIIAPVNEGYDEKSLKEKIKNVISDNFTLKNEENDGSGVVTPIFSNNQDKQDYFFMMVPVIPAPTKN